MDNSPRNAFLKGGGCGLDISAEMVLFTRQLSEIASILGRTEDARRFDREAEALADLVKTKMWDPGRRFFYDLKLDGERAPVKTIAAYWTLLAKVADQSQAADLVRELSNPVTFGRAHRGIACLGVRRIRRRLLSGSRSWSARR